MSGHEKRCTECGYQFSAIELAKEDTLTWGHPCRMDERHPQMRCESFRRVVAMPTAASRCWPTLPIDAPVSEKE